MGTFEVVRLVAAPVADTFSVVGDLTAYGRFLPMTRIVHDPGPVAVGWRFTGLTGPRPLVLPDRMRVSAWDPPHGFAVEKLGPVLDGWAEARLEPFGQATRIVWREEIVVRPAAVGRVLAPLSDRVNTWLFSRALGRMSRELMPR